MEHNWTEKEVAGQFEESISTLDGLNYLKLFASRFGEMEAFQSTQCHDILMCFVTFKAFYSDPLISNICTKLPLKKV